ncbi:TetR/AcrR family transcriptional regulator [Kitasatospora purpeofusca]|uniref:TetR/AcrR family transcriptional regulator n=1 Tax=Kitasatospora purpeofusca TaxID=67352 RepID=UPI002E0FF026|nr:TetR/AcrR family transcriptional regulator [Kitasatospora purpeofusca]WSR37852.1 TetR/AcrR family transcriptional regulator [Kitasatospora purpeofusca]
MPTGPSPNRRTGGRLRSEEAHDAVLAAAIELVEELGYQAVTVERIAARADVAKSTIYRWWKSRATLVMDAYRAAVEQRMPQPDTGSLAGDLTAFATALYGVTSHPLRVQTLRGLMAEAQLDPAFAEPFRDWVESRRAVVSAILARGAQRGDLPPTADLDAVTDQLFGLFWYRLLVGHQPLDPAQAATHIDQLLHGLQPRHHR